MFENLDDPRKQALLALAAGLLSPVRGKGWSGFGEAASQGINAGLLGFNQAQRTQEAVKRGEMDRKLEQMRLDQAKRQQEYQTGFDALSKQYFQPGVTPSTPVDDNGYPMPSSAPKADLSGFISQLPTLGWQGVKDALGYQQLLAKENPLDKYKPEKYTPDSIAKFVVSRNPADLKLYEPPKESWGPVSPQDIQAYRLPQNGQGFQKNSVTGQIRAVGSGPQVQVNTVDTASNSAAKDFMKGVSANYERLRDAPAALVNLEKAKELIPEARGFVGAGGEQMLNAAKFLNNRLGMNIDTEGVSNAEELRTRIFFNVMDNLKKLDAQPSQLQQKIMMESLGTIGTDPNALPKVLSAFGDSIRAKIVAHNRDVSSAEARGVKFPFDASIPLPEAPKKSGVSVSGTTVTLSDGRSIPFPSEAAAKAYAAEAKKKGW